MKGLGVETVEAFAEALCHFERELPDLDVLRSLLDPAAMIVDEQDGHRATRTASAWQASLVIQALLRREENRGYFVHVLEHSTIATPSAVCVTSLWEERVTEGERTVSKRRLACDLRLRPIGGALRIAFLSVQEVTVEAPSGPRR